MTKRQRRRKLEKDIKEAKWLRDQFSTEKPLIQKYIDDKREKLTEIYRD